MTTNAVLHSLDLADRLDGTTLLVDTTAFIDASSKNIFMEFMMSLADSNCSLATIPSVLYEFKRGAKDLEQAKKYNQVISDLKLLSFPQIESLAQEEDNQYFTMLYNTETANGRKEKGPSYTDALLCLTMYIYHQQTDIKLLTSNYKDIPLSLFDREDLIIYDTGRDVRTAAIYSLSEKKLSAKLDQKN